VVWFTSLDGVYLNAKPGRRFRALVLAEIDGHANLVSDERPCPRLAACRKQRKQMDISQLTDIFLHLDKHLNYYADLLGPWLYGLLFLIIFCETGLVVTPILPGDSLLFAVGALAARPGSSLSLPWLMILLIGAAILGDAVNYTIGYLIGPRVFKSERARLLNKKHLLRAHRFYEMYGGKTIILARFIPIIRTFAPFVAGIGAMQYRRFCLYNITGGISWVLLFLLAGYQLGSYEWVEGNFHFIGVAIVFISVLPMVIELLLGRRRVAQPLAVESEKAVV
jgi:membrane-associated protein